MQLVMGYQHPQLAHLTPVSHQSSLST